MCMEGGLKDGGKQSVPLGRGRLFSFLTLRVESEERSAQKFSYRVGDETQGLDLGEENVREYL